MISVLSLSRINNISDVRNGDRCFCDIGGNNKFSTSLRSGFQYFLLVIQKGSEQQTMNELNIYVAFNWVSFPSPLRSFTTLFILLKFISTKSIFEHNDYLFYPSQLAWVYIQLAAFYESSSICSQLLLYSHQMSFFRINGDRKHFCLNIYDGNFEVK